MKIKKPAFALVLFLLGFLSFASLFAQPASSQERISNIRYEIWVELDNQKKMLFGKENLTWFNKTQDEVQDMWFHLYYNAFKNENSTVLQEYKEESLFGIKVKEEEWGYVDVTKIELADGRELKPTMEFVTADEPVHPGDQTVIRVRFPEPIKPGQKVHLKLEFQSKIPRTILRSGYYQNSYFIAQWFPKLGVYEEGKGWNCHEYHLSSEFFADFADFVVHITAPSNFVVGASGKQTGVEPDEKKKTMTYTFEQTNIHDFAWTADPDYIKIERDFIADCEVSHKEYEEIAQKLGFPLDEVKLHNVKMILLIKPEHKGQIERHFKALRAAIKYYSLWYGPYPYETVTMVDPPFRTGSGGMEYPTLFTAGTSVLLSKNAFYPEPEMVIVHEFGHSFWYGLCANNEFEEAWLDEGINSYSTGKVDAKAYGKGEMSLNLKGFPLNWFFNLPKFYDYELDRAAALTAVKLDPIVTFSWKFFNRMSYNANVYMRASTCLNTLERLVGEETMLRIMRTFQMHFRFKHPHTQDFINVVCEITGKDFNWFFDQLFFNTLNFDYGISSLRSYEKPKHARGIFDVNGKKKEWTDKNVAEQKEKKAEKEEVYITQVKVRRFGEAKVGGDVKIKLKVVFEDGSEEVRFWEGLSRWANFTFEKPVKAKQAEIDPDHIWIIDSNFANNSLKLGPSRSGILRLAGKFLFWVQNYLQLFSSLS